MWNNASRMGRIALLFAFLFASPLLLLAQQAVTIRGRVFERGKAMPSVVISVHNASGVLVGYSISDTIGAYTVRYSCSSDSVAIRVNAFNIKAQEHKLMNKSQERNFNVELASFELQEIIAKPPKIYSVGDTVSYSVREWAVENDQNLEELLRRLPGIAVADDGVIMYNGRPINRFYIEGLDLMGGNYAMITSRLKPSAVETIQVLENHQHVKALRDIQREEEAAINLKLRSEVRNVWMFDATAGVGFERPCLPLRRADFSAIQLSKQRQVFSGVGGNNVGLVSRIQADDQVGLYAPQGLLASARLADPPINPSLYRRNMDAEAHTSLVQRTARGWDMRMNAMYQRSDDRPQAHQRATFPSLADDTTAYSRSSDAHEWADFASLNLHAELNTDSLYVLQRVYGFMDRRGGNTALLFNGKEVQERLNSSSYALYSTATVVNRRGRGHEVNVRASLGRAEQLLRLNGVRDSFFLWHDTTGFNMRQAAMRNSAYASIFGRLLDIYKRKKWSLDPTVAIQLSLDNIGTDLDAIGAASRNDSLRNRLLYANAKLLVGAKLRYEHRRFSAMFDLAASGQMCMVRMELPSALVINRFVPMVLPGLTFDYSPKRNIQFLLKYNLTQVLPLADELYEGYVLSNYQSLGRCQAALSRTLVQRGQFSVSHRRVLDMWFQQLRVSYSYGMSESLPSMELRGMLTEVRHVPQRGNALSYGADYSASKGFDLLEGCKLSLGMGYRHEARDVLVARQRIVQQSDRYSLSEGIIVKPLSWLSVEHSVEYGIGRSSLAGVSGQHVGHNMRGALAVLLEPLRGLSAKAETFAYRGSYQSRSYNFWLANFEAGYKWVNWKFSLRWNNIGNLRQFESIYVTAMQRSHTVQRVRGAAVLLTAALSFR